MNSYCVKCRKDTENIDPKMFRTKNNRLIMQSKYPLCGIKKSRFVKEQEAKGLLNNLGIRTPLSKIPLLNVFFLRCIKMNEIVNKFLLVRDKFMPNLVLLTVFVVHLPKTKKELKRLWKLEILILFIEMNLMRLVFNMIWLMEKQKI